MVVIAPRFDRFRLPPLLFSRPPIETRLKLLAAESRIAFTRKSIVAHGGRWRRRWRRGRTTGPRAASGRSREPLKIQRAEQMVPGRNEKTRIVERDVDERAERGATGRTRAPKAEGGRGITLGSGNTAVARLRATVVPVTESSDPSAASLPPTSSAAGASFLRARPPRPLLLILPPPAARRPPAYLL